MGHKMEPEWKPKSIEKGIRNQFRAEEGVRGVQVVETTQSSLQHTHAEYSRNKSRLPTKTFRRPSKIGVSSAIEKGSLR